MFGRIADREIFVSNVLVGIITSAVAFNSAFGAGADISSVRSAALTLLFSVTYIWFAANRAFGLDGRGLAICWGKWAGLWFMFFYC